MSSVLSNNNTLIFNTKKWNSSINLKVKTHIKTERILKYYLLTKWFISFITNSQITHYTYFNFKLFFTFQLKDFEESRSSLISIYQKLGKSFDFGSDNSKYGFLKSDFDDADSQFSFSSSNSPSQVNQHYIKSYFSYMIMIIIFFQGTNGIDQDNSILESPISSKIDANRLDTKSPDPMNSIGVQIISSSGGHIIAVANPALALSPALSEHLSNVKREVVSPELR